MVLCSGGRRTAAYNPRWLPLRAHTGLLLRRQRSLSSPLLLAATVTAEKTKGPFIFLKNYKLVPLLNLLELCWALSASFQAQPPDTFFSPRTSPSLFQLSSLSLRPLTPCELRWCTSALFRSTNQTSLQCVFSSTEIKATHRTRHHGCKTRRRSSCNNDSASSSWTGRESGK